MIDVFKDHEIKSVSDAGYSAIEFGFVMTSRTILSENRRVASLKSPSVRIPSTLLLRDLTIDPGHRLRFY